MLIDDGSEERDQRKNMFDIKFKYLGIGCAKHKDRGYCTAFIYVKSLRNIGDPANMGLITFKIILKKLWGKEILKID